MTFGDNHPSINKEGVSYAVMESVSSCRSIHCRG